MELLKAKYKIRCELGACKNVAKHTIKLSRVGIRSQIHICDDCVKELYRILGELVVPKSIETMKKKDSFKDAAEIVSGDTEVTKSTIRKNGAKQ